MSYPFNNPDVDPLSQNQRIHTLEGRPSGGGGAGGGGPYKIPDFDLYPDNSIKVYPDVGLVGKVTIPPSPQVIPNVEMRYCFYRPMVAGGPFGPTFLFVREYNSVAWYVPIDPYKIVTANLNHEIDCEDFYQAYISGTNVKHVAILYTPFDVRFTASPTNSHIQLKFTLNIAPPSKPLGIKSYITMQPYLVTPNPPSNLSLPSGYRFLYEVSGMQGPPTFYIQGPLNQQGVFLYSSAYLSSGGSVTVANLQDLPSVYKSIFPQTWTR